MLIRHKTFLFKLITWQSRDYHVAALSTLNEHINWIDAKQRVVRAANLKNNAFNTKTTDDFTNLYNNTKFTQIDKHVLGLTTGWQESRVFGIN